MIMMFLKLYTCVEVFVVDLPFLVLMVLAKLSSTCAWGGGGGVTLAIFCLEGYFGSMAAQTKC